MSTASPDQISITYRSDRTFSYRGSEYRYHYLRIGYGLDLFVYCCPHYGCPREIGYTSERQFFSVFRRHIDSHWRLGKDEEDRVLFS